MKQLGEILREAFASGGVVRVLIEGELPEHGLYVSALLDHLTEQLKFLELPVERWKEGAPKAQLKARFEVEEDARKTYGFFEGGPKAQSGNVTLDRASWSKTVAFKTPDTITIPDRGRLPTDDDVARATAEGVKPALPFPW